MLASLLLVFVARAVGDVAVYDHMGRVLGQLERTWKHQVAEKDRDNDRCNAHERAMLAPLLTPDK